MFFWGREAFCLIYLFIFLNVDQHLWLDFLGPFVIPLVGVPLYRCQCKQLSKKYCMTSTECTEMIILVGGCVFFNYQFKERQSVREVYGCGIGVLVSINDTSSC